MMLQDWLNTGVWELPIVRAVGVTKTYGGGGEPVVQALRGINLAIEQGDFLAIMGPSGSGKSTLLSILGGLESTTYGQVYIEERSLSGRAEAELAVLRREKIGFVFQGFNLIPVMTAEENVAVPLLLAGMKGAAVRERVERIMGLVGLADRRTHLPAELSGGQQQRVALARALVTEPALLLADEPTGNLDSRTSREVMTLLRQAADTLGQTVVLVTHDAEVAAWANRVLFLRDGLVVAEEKGDGDLTERAHRVRSRLEAITAELPGEGMDVGAGVVSAGDADA